MASRSKKSDFPLLYNENKALLYNNYVTSIKHLLTLSCDLSCVNIAKCQHSYKYVHQISKKRQRNHNYR